MGDAGSSGDGAGEEPDGREDVARLAVIAVGCDRGAAARTGFVVPEFQVGPLQLPADESVEFESRP